MPFLGKVFLAYPLPITLSERGIVNTTLEEVGKITPIQNTELKFFLYKDIHHAEFKGSSLIINSELFCKCGSPQQAANLTQLILNIICSKRRIRELHRYLGTLFDIKKLQLSHDFFAHVTRPLEWLCNFQFFFLLVIAPILIYQYGNMWLIISGIVLIINNFVILIFFFLAHQKIFHDRTGELVTDILKMLLCPPMAIRAIDILSLRYLASYHPLTVARFFLNDSNFRLFAKQTLFDLSHSLTIILGENIKDDLHWHLNAMNLKVKQFLEGFGIMISDLVTAPEPEDGALSYCPRCHAQYIIKIGQCSDCRVVDLIKYKGINDE